MVLLLLKLSFFRSPLNPYTEKACTPTSYFLCFFYTLNLIYINKATALDQPLPANYFIPICPNSKYHLVYLGTQNVVALYCPCISVTNRHYAAFISIPSPLRHPTFSTRTVSIPGQYSSTSVDESFFGPYLSKC